jgi:hypothetical protein
MSPGFLFNFQQKPAVFGCIKNLHFSLHCFKFLRLKAWDDFLQNYFNSFSMLKSVNKTSISFAT